MNDSNIEELRKQLLNEAYSGAFGGHGVMILDADLIERATENELVEIAKRYEILNV